MVATDLSNESFPAGREEAKSMLTNVRYINKKESVMCFCHLDDDVQSDGRASVPSDAGTESEEDTCKSETSSDSDSGKPKKKSVRKSVRFLHENDSDALSIASEPIKSVHVITDFNCSKVLPPIVQDSNVTTPRDVEKGQDKWATKRPSAVPDRMFQTLTSLNLSPRITRKMSLETIADIKKAIAESRESMQKGNGKRPLRKTRGKLGSPESLQSIPEIGYVKATKAAPRRLKPVDPQTVKSSANTPFVETSSELEKLDFIKRALSPLPENATTEFYRNRAMTISCGEKRSYLMKRRNSKETISTEWLDTQTQSVKNMPVQKTVEDCNLFDGSSETFTTIDLTRL